MQRNNGDMIIYSGKYVSFESSATVEPRQRVSNIYLYLYVSDQSVFIGSEMEVTLKGPITTAADDKICDIFQIFEKN